jgi:hypothetical protein
VAIFSCPSDLLRASSANELRIPHVAGNAYRYAAGRLWVLSWVIALAGRTDGIPQALCWAPSPFAGVTELCMLLSHFLLNQVQLTGLLPNGLWTCGYSATYCFGEA